MTKKLYYSDPYIINWNTTIISTMEKKDKIFVELGETAFYPGGGGQPVDIGKIDGLEVEDVQIINNTIYHVVQKLPGQKFVSCEIDWKTRFDHMQQHTAQHLLSAVIEELYQIPTVSFHLGKDYTTIDLETNKLTPDQLILIEEKANHYITKNLPIDTYFVTQEQLSEIPLRKLPKVTDHIRIVDIKNLDISACAGTHVNQTGELNLLKVIKTEKQRGQTRLFFLSGERARNDYQNAHMILERMSLLFQTNKLELFTRLEKLDKEKKELVKENDYLKNQMNEHFVHSLLENNQGDIVKEVFEDRSMKDITQLAKLLITKSSSILLFASALDRKILLQHNGSQPIHCGDYIKSFVSNYGGKGGGNQLLAQATFQKVEDLLLCMEELSKLIQKEISH